MTVLITVLAVVVALLGVLVVGLLRSHAEILRALHELGVDLDPDSDAPALSSPRGVGTLGGATVPRPRAEPRAAVDVAGHTPSGDAASVAVVGVTHSTLLAFLTSGCSTCAEFWTAFADRRALERVPGGARLVVVTKGEDSESPARLRRFVPPDVPVIMSSEAWTAYDVPVAPYFAYVDGGDGRIVGEGAAGSWDHLVGMMEQALSDAGIDTRAGRRGRRAGGRERAEQIDRDLLSAGIEPGHPSLYPSSQADLHPQGHDS
jgi:hypothetical protein